MWTGDKVIPKDITLQSLEEITTVLKRAPVIWDNEHANDYDQKRVYLGPYSGRSPDIIPKLRGVMTNPNCEYGANFVAIHSLALWSRCTVDGCDTLSGNETVTYDIKLEIGSPGDGHPAPPPNNLPSHVYHPRHALRSAVSQWLLELYKNKPMWGPITKPQVGLNPIGVLKPSVNTCLVTTCTTSSINTPLPSSLPGATGAGPPRPESEPGAGSGVSGVNPAESAGQTSAVSSSLPLVTTPLVPVMNSLVSHNVVVMERSVEASGGDMKSGPEPMEVIPTSPSHTMDSMTSPPTPSAGDSMATDPAPLTNPPTPASVMEQEQIGGNGVLSKADSVTMLCDDQTLGTKQLDNQSINSAESALMTAEELENLCDLYYLPWEHGPKALQILNEFYWLKTHAGVMLVNSNLHSPSEDESDDVDVQVRTLINDLIY